MRSDTALPSPGSLPIHLRVLLAATVFSAFLTQTSFVPEALKHNVGVFELTGGALIVLGVLRLDLGHLREMHPVTRTTGLILIAAALSQINIPGGRGLAGMLNVAILIFLFLFLLVGHALLVQFQVSPGVLLRMVVYAVLLLGPWIVIQTTAAPDNLDLSGPFRNRAHMASYMLTCFWLTLAYAQWPRLPRFERIAAYLAMATSLYALAIAGRRSVYLSLFIGLALLATGILATRGRRVSFAAAGAFAVAVLVALYAFGEPYLPRLAFFRSRVALIDDRLEQAIGTSVDQAVETSFFQLQLQGVRMAVTDHPLLGIGWGGFAKSPYSPTGHEVHSTPLRFIAELGLVGILLYTLLTWQLLAASARTFRSLRPTPLSASSFTLFAGLTSLVVSYLYNRHVTERTFWLLLLVILTLHTFAGKWESGRQAGALEEASPGRSR